MMDLSDSWSNGLLRLFFRQGPFPKHIGVIMDGNRHYARERGVPLEEGYEMGSRTFESMVEFCFAAGVKAMTFYAFSIANFQRSNEEIQVVMSLIQRVCLRLMEPGSAAKRFGINVRLCGKKALLPTEIVQTIERAEKTLGGSADRVLNICLAYGSRDEITSSFRAAIMKHYHQLPASGKDNPSKHNITGSSEHQNMHQKMPHLLSSRCITVDALDDEMFTAGCPPMDLLVRTSGTNRLSDFMLWQCHQDTEIVILKANWPELTAWDFMQAHRHWLLRASLSNFVTSVRKSPDILQIMISCFYIILLLLMRVLNKVFWYFHVVRNDPAYILRDKEVSLEMIHKDTRRLNKLPTHLSVIIRLTDDSNAFDIAISTVADFIILCISVGIPLLSVYERTGKLKSHQDLVHRNVATKLSRHYGAGRHNSNVDVSGIGKPKTIEKCGPAGFSLLLLSAQDGRESLAEICNALGSSIRRGESLPEEIDTAQIDKMLKAKLLASLHDNPIGSHPIAKGMMVGSRKGTRDNNRNILSLRVLDPDILFIFGSSIQFDGYPPWQLANPEIFCVDENPADFGRHRSSIAYRIFLQGLHRYAGADIRLGR